MTLILANLPKQYQDAAKSYIQQTIRNNVSGELSKSWCKIKIRQFSTNIRNKKLPLIVTSSSTLLNRFGWSNALISALAGAISFIFLSSSDWT